MRQLGKQISLPFDAESSSHTFHMGLPALSYFPFHNRTDIIRLQIPYGKRMVLITSHFPIPFRKIRRFFGVYTVCPDKKVSSKEICFSGGVRATKHSVSGSSSQISLCLLCAYRTVAAVPPPALPSYTASRIPDRSTIQRLRSIMQKWVYRSYRQKRSSQTARMSSYSCRAACGQRRA